MLDASALDGEALADGETVAMLVAETIIRRALAWDFPFLVEPLNRTEGRCAERDESPAAGRVVPRWEEGPIALARGDEASSPTAPVGARLARHRAPGARRRADRIGRGSRVTRPREGRPARGLAFVPGLGV